MREPDVTSGNSPIDAMRALGDLDALLSAASATAAESDDQEVGPVNSHLHLPPNFSAFETVRDAMEQAAGEGIRAVGVNNYYGFDIYTEFAVRAALGRVFPLFGMEVICLLEDLQQAGTLLNDPANPGKMYLCGKALWDIAPMNERAAATMNRIRQLDSDRMHEMLAKLETVSGERGVDVRLDPEVIRRKIARNHGCPSEIVYFQERHAAQALQEAIAEGRSVADQRALLSKVTGEDAESIDPGNRAKVQDLIRSRLIKAGKPAYVAEQFVDYPSAAEMILELGGIPCYPVLLDAADRISDFEDTPESLAERLRAMNIHAVEFITFRNSAEVLDRYATALAEMGFIVTAGTEHNTLAPMPIKPAGPGGSPISPAVDALFTEGACVLAAHQVLGVHGQAGWVHRTGQPTHGGNPAERKKELAAIGAAAIRRFRRIGGQD